MSAVRIGRIRSTPAAPIRGPGAIGMLNVRCLVVLAAANAALGGVVVIGTGLTSLGSAVDAAAVASFLSGIGFVLEILVIALAIAGVLIALIGVPAGLVTGRALHRAAREWVHVLTFAAVGAALAVAMVLVAGLGQAAVWAALEGAVGAGGARWWSGASYRRDEGVALNRVREQAARAADDVRLVARAGEIS